MGVVEVKVLKATKLNNQDNFTTNDAFVELWLNDDDYKQKTNTISAKDPEWNQTFTINYDNTDKIHFRVLDKDLFDTDGIGKATFDFGHLIGRKGQSETKDLTLKAHALDFTPTDTLPFRLRSSLEHDRARGFSYPLIDIYRFGLSWIMVLELYTFPL
ncbi:C2 domain-containing protein [Chytridium lagenaria]|nr:C2 domain-containing protein [Chytridium lagenaria]